MKAERDNAAELLQTQAREQGLTLGTAEFPNERSFAIAVTPATDERKLDDTVKRYLPDWAVARPPGASGSSRSRTSLCGRSRTAPVSQAVETIRNRIDEFGVSEPLIARAGI